MRVAIVEDDASLCMGMARALEARGARTFLAATVRAALELFDAQTFDLVVLDIGLPDGRGVEVARAALHLRPMPAVIAVSGAASADEAFELATLGVRGYLTKPLSLDKFEAEVARLMGETPSIAAHAASNVGQRGLHQVQLELRQSMLRQALAKSEGNKTRAAEMLQLTRQAIQSMLRDMHPEDVRNRKGS
jgi:DNA-binding NtrC family response regulator